MVGCMSEEVKGGWGYRVRKGGLMQCCLRTLEDVLLRMANAEEPQPAVGERIRCTYHGNYMIRAEDGAWEWDPDA